MLAQRTAQYTHHAAKPRSKKKKKGGSKSLNQADLKNKDQSLSLDMHLHALQQSEQTRNINGEELSCGIADPPTQEVSQVN